MPRVKSYGDKHGHTAVTRTVPRIASRSDNWENAFTGLNVIGKDKRTASTPTALILTEHQAEALYAADPHAAKIVDLLPEDMTREGFDLVSSELEDEEIKTIEHHITDKLHWAERFTQALSWADLYGGSAILLGIDDGSSDLSRPLNEESIIAFDFMTVLTRYELQMERVQDDPSQANYGMPVLYKIVRRISSPNSPALVPHERFVHASRLIRFDGAHLPRGEFIRNGYWSDSVLSRLFRPLQNFATTHDSVASLMQDFSQAVFKIKNLADILSAQDGKQLISERINMVELSRSLINAVIIAEDEEFERKTTSLAGVEDVLRKMEERLVSGTQYPHTILLGEAPGGGIGDKGKSEHRDYYDFVRRKQMSRLMPGLKRFMRFVMLAKNGPTKGRIPENWSLKFRPLWQQTLTETLEQRLNQAKIDTIYINDGVLSPDEVAVSRFESGEYSHDQRLYFDRNEEEPLPTMEEQLAMEAAAKANPKADDPKDGLKPKTKEEDMVKTKTTPSGVKKRSSRS
jgi:phage-related protein (TIGR01555 family)